MHSNRRETFFASLCFLYRSSFRFYPAPIIRQFGVIGATRPFSLSRTNLHVLGEMSKEHGKIKRYSSSRSGTTLRSQSRIKIIYTTFTQSSRRPRAAAPLTFFARLNFPCNFSRIAETCARASANRLFHARINRYKIIERYDFDEKLRT